MPSEELVTIAIYSNPIEARLAKARLEESGVTVSLTGEEIALTQWSLTQANGAIRVQVAARDAVRADEILSDPAYDDSYEGLSEVAGDATSPEPDEVQQYGSPNQREELANRAYRAAMLGIPYIFLQPYATWLLWHASSNSDLPLRAEYARRLEIAQWINFVMGLLVVCWIVVTFGSIGR